jgi:hypothetical protein
MRGAPVHPDEYDGEHLNTDEKLQAQGWAAGLDVWEQVGKAYEWYLANNEEGDTLGNAQLWSLSEAIRRDERRKIAAELRTQVDYPGVKAIIADWLEGQAADG